MTDVYGARGGIGKFNRDLLRAIGADDCRVNVLARESDILTSNPSVTIDPLAPRGRAPFVAAAARQMMFGRYDAVVCGHICLLPIGGIVARARRVPLVLVVHGIEAWEPRRNALQNFWARRVDAAVAVSTVTRERFLRWSFVSHKRVYVLNNCVDTAAFSPGPKDPQLLQRYRLHNRSVVLTVARLDSRERYKGIDEVMRALPLIATKVPEVAYLIVGDGDDRSRLEALTRELQIDHRVRFAGHVSEEEKAHHYRLADVFVLPGRGEGFGIVYLEAMSCGVPVIGSKLDGSRDALKGGELGALVDPDDVHEITDAVVRALSQPHRVPEGLADFEQDRFDQRAGALFRAIAGGRPSIDNAELRRG